MPYIRTKLATDWPENDTDSWFDKIIKVLFWFIPRANPGYSGKMHLVYEWYIEFIDGRPWREVGVDSSGRPVIAGPTDENYGFWLDTNMKFEDFSGRNVEATEFERLWGESGAREPK